MTTTVVPRDPVQRHVVRTLVGTQVLGGVGLSAGIAVGALLAEDVSGSAEFAGLGGTFQVLGAALIAIPMSRLMAARGRRPGLVLGYGLAAVGAVGLITAGVVRSFPLLLVASVLFGGATASNSQSRYAAADLALPAHRARDLSIVVWATTVGSVIGPNLAGPSAPLARSLGLPELTGPFLFSLVGLLLAITLIVLRLRPTPSLEARRRSVADGDAFRPGPRLGDPGAAGRGRHPRRPAGAGHHGTGARDDGQRHGDDPAAHVARRRGARGHRVRHQHPHPRDVRVLAADRPGGRPLRRPGGGGARLGRPVGGGIARVGVAGGGVGDARRRVCSCSGSGWSCTLVAGSTLLTAAVPVRERPGAQGASDLVMGLIAGAGGALAGVVVDRASFEALALGALGVAVTIGLAAALSSARPGPATA